MQIVLENEDEKGNSRRTNLIGLVICARGISRCIEGKFIREFGKQKSRIWVSRRIFVRIKKRVWRRDKALVKVAELRRIEQRRRNIEEFVQKF